MRSSYTEVPDDPDVPVFTADEVAVALGVLAALPDALIDSLGSSNGDPDFVRETALRARIVFGTTEDGNGTRTAHPPVEYLIVVNPPTNRDTLTPGT